MTEEAVYHHENGGEVFGYYREPHAPYFNHEGPEAIVLNLHRIRSYSASRAAVTLEEVLGVVLAHELAHAFAAPQREVLLQQMGVEVGDELEEIFIADRATRIAMQALNADGFKAQIRYLSVLEQMVLSIPLIREGTLADVTRLFVLENLMMKENYEVALIGKVSHGALAAAADGFHVLPRVDSVQKFLAAARRSVSDSHIIFVVDEKDSVVREQLEETLQNLNYKDRLHLVYTEAVTKADLRDHKNEIRITGLLGWSEVLSIAGPRAGGQSLNELFRNPVLKALAEALAETRVKTSA